jgi:hypothetical protein
MKLVAVLVLVAATVLAAPPANAGPPRPQVTKLSVTSGSVAGGTKVTVRGRHFSRRSKVLFGGVRARTSYRSSHALIATTPAHAAGVIRVVVRTGRRTSRPSMHSRFSYVAEPLAAAPVVWAQVAVGVGHTCATKTDGSLWCWGNNRYGQLGNSTNVGVNAANPLPARVGTASDWGSVDVGYADSCGIRTDHTLWCWGGNYDGQLGDPGNSAYDTVTPNRVGTASNWSSVSVGFAFVCATRTDGTLWCWGSNDSGQLGNPTNAGSPAANPAPTQVGTATDWALVRAGDYHACAIRRDGTLWCWGDNYYGQLGNPGGTGSATPHPTPSQVGTATDWQSLGAGANDTCATKATGTLWCWGDQFSSTVSQLGTGTSWRSVSNGDYHVCGTTSSGALSCWGYNDVGQLGLGTSDTSYHDFGQIGTATWTEVDAGYRASCGVRSDGTLWCWGENYYGKLGSTANNGTYNPNPVPIEVPN